MKDDKIKTSHEQRFRFGSRSITLQSKEKLEVEKLIDRDIIKSYLIKSKAHKYALVQCTNKYFIVLYFGQECGYIENKKTKTRDLFEFDCPEGDLTFFNLRKYQSFEYLYDYENSTIPSEEKIVIYKDGVFYINSKGYTHNEKERVRESNSAV